MKKHMERIERYVTVNVGDMPEHIDMKRGEFYYSAEWKCVKFHCPCGCGIEVYLPISTDQAEADATQRCWFFKEDNGPYLSPSIQQTGHCGSHYHIEHGIVRWS